MIPPKDKFFVLAGLDINKNIALLSIIGSELEMAAATSPKLRQMMIGMDVSDYQFLQYTSKLNCSKVILKELKEVDSGIRNGQFTYQGELLGHHYEKMTKLLLSSDRVSPSYKDIIRGRVVTLIEFKP